MSIEINLSPILANQLQIQAAELGLSLNELAEKLICQGLSKQIWQEPVSAVGNNIDTSSQNLASNSAIENRAEMTCRDFLLSVAGTFSSGKSDTSTNVKSIVSDMLLKRDSRYLNQVTLIQSNAFSYDVQEKYHPPKSDN